MLASHTDVRGFEPHCGGRLPTIISGSVLVYALHSLENVLGHARLRVFVPTIIIIIIIFLSVVVDLFISYNYIIFTYDCIYNSFETTYI